MEGVGFTDLLGRKIMIIKLPLQRFSKKNNCWHINHRWADCAATLSNPVQETFVELWGEESLEENCLMFTKTLQGNPSEVENVCMNCSRSFLSRLKRFGVKRLLQVS